MNEQRTPEWFAQRCGKITASRISAVLAKAKKGADSSLTRDNYRAQLVLERMTGVERESGYQSKAMERGTELEPNARAAYDTKFDVMVEPVGFVQHPRIKNAGCSPDGFVGEDGMIQIKCPFPANHMAWQLRGGVPTEHRKQMAMELACCPERKWNEFVSYCPEMPAHLQIFTAKLTREAAKDTIEEIEREVLKLDAEVDDMIRHLPKDESLEEALTNSVSQAKAAKLEKSLYIQGDEMETATR